MGELRRLENFIFSRLALLSVILVFTICLRQEVLGAQTMIQIYGVLSFSFLISLVNLIFWEQTQKARYIIASQVLYDTLLTSYLVFLTGIDESIFLFVYLLNIVFAATIYQIQGALAMAALAGLSYGLIYAINADDSVNSIYTLAYSELLFLLTALLCGQLMGELKRQKENILQLENLHKQLLNNVPVGVVAVDSTAHVQSVNRAALEMLGLKKTPELRKKYFDLMPEIQGAPEAWERMPERNKVRFHFTQTFPGGETKQLSLQVVQNDKSGFILVLQDISKVLDLEARLELESKLAATGQLAAGIAHEIRNPLASISGSIETLGQHLKLTDEEDKKLLSISLREIKRLNKLVTDFLEFAKPKQEKAEAFELRRKILEVVETVQSRNQSLPAQFKIEIPANLKVFANAERLKQVFLNLFLNSIEAAQEKAAVIFVVARKEGEEASIDVKDEGPGIPNELAEKIFDPFFTTKSSGTGLGLSTVAQILKSAKGSIQLLPSHKGALFRITLPCKAEITAKAEGAA